MYVCICVYIYIYIYIYTNTCIPVAKKGVQQVEGGGGGEWIQRVHCPLKWTAVLPPNRVHDLARVQKNCTIIGNIFSEKYQLHSKKIKRNKRQTSRPRNAWQFNFWWCSSSTDLKYRQLVVPKSDQHPEASHPQLSSVFVECAMIQTNLILVSRRQMKHSNNKLWHQIHPLSWVPPLEQSLTFEEVEFHQS